MIVVFKIGDRAMVNAFSDSALKDLLEIQQTTQSVIVHGGGDTVTKIASQLKIPQKFIISPEGFKSRLTDEDTIEIYTMVMGGKINKKIVRDLQKVGILAVGLSGLDARILQASRKNRIISREPDGRRRVVEGGYTGSLTAVEGDLINVLLSKQYMPVIAPIALGTSCEALNVDGDRAAAKIASSLQADTLVLLTDVDYVRFDDKPVTRCTLQDARRMLPQIGPGMNTKLQAAIEAVSNGVPRAVIAPSQVPCPYSDALSGRSGTMIMT